jgi:hypothetical protein
LGDIFIDRCTDEEMNDGNAHGDSNLVDANIAKATGVGGARQSAKK